MDGSTGNTVNLHLSPMTALSNTTSPCVGCWRFGQTRPVNDLVVTVHRAHRKEQLQRKSRQADEMFRAMVEHMHEANGHSSVQRHCKGATTNGCLRSSDHRRSVYALQRRLGRCFDVAEQNPFLDGIYCAVFIPTENGNTALATIPAATATCQTRTGTMKRLRCTITSSSNLIA